MSATTNNTSYTQNRIGSLIASGMRIDGHIEFKGVLHVQGDVIGNVTCASDPQGAVVISESGSVTGTVKAPQLVVRGRVEGPTRTTDVIEVHQDASVVGGAVYKKLVVHAGGVVKGLLTPLDLLKDDPSAQQHLQDVSAPPIAVGDASPVDNKGFAFNMRVFGWAVALLLAVGAGVWIDQMPPAAVLPSPELPVAEAPVVADVAVVAPPAEQSVAEVDDGPTSLRDEPVVDVAPVVPVKRTPIPVSPAPVAPVAVVPSHKVEERRDVNKVVVVRGVNPAKPADGFFLLTREPVVFYRKRRDEQVEGRRAEVAKGINTRISIRKDELFRIAQGADFDMFYQGGKVSSAIIESGAWMSFVPLAPAVVRNVSDAADAVDVAPVADSRDVAAVGTEAARGDSVEGRKETVVTSLPSVEPRQE